MEEMHATTIEQMKRSVYYQLITIDNYQKAIGVEVVQLLELVRVNMRDIHVIFEDSSKNYEALHGPLIQLHKSSKDLYKMLKETKAGVLFQLEKLMNRSRIPKRQLASNGSKSSVNGVPPKDLKRPKEIINGCVGEGFVSCDPELHMSRRNISQVNGPCDHSITSKYELDKVQEKELLVKPSNERVRVDQPLEVRASNVYRDLRMSKVDDKLTSESTNLTQQQIWKEDPLIFAGKCKPSNSKQIYVARSEREVWDTFEFTASGSNTEDEEKRTCDTQIVIPTLDVTSSQEPRSNNDALQQSNPFDQIPNSRRYIVSPQQCVRPYNSLEPLTDSQFANAHVESDAGSPLTENIQEFQYCRWQEMEIRVSYVVDPHYFYIQHIGQELPELMRKLNVECSQDSATMCCIPVIRSYVCAWLPENKQWYRAYVINVVAPEETVTTVTTGGHQHVLVEILCIDYGFSAALSVSHLKKLPETFYALPQQALRVSLENVSPVHGDVWCRSDIRWFKKLVKNKTFFARLYQKLNDVTVVLFSERGKIGIMRRGSTLSQKMAAAGFARLSEADCTSSPKGRPSIPWHWKQRIIKLLSEATHLKK